MKVQLVLLGAIVVLAVALRFISLGTLPTGFTADEAAQGYTAYSLLTTGKDEWGNVLPLNLRSFGDFKAPLYTYATIPSVAMFGLNEFAVRLPAALFGIASVAFTYLLAKQLTNDETMALIAALLLAISPWHVALSRGAFEANVTTCLLTAGIYFLLRGTQRPWYLWPALIFLGLNMFSYHSARLVTPVIIAVVVYYSRSRLKQHMRRVITPLVLLGCVIVVALATFLQGGSTRASDVAIYSPTGGWAQTADRRFEAVTAGAPDSIARFFTNKPSYVANIFTKNYLSYFGTEFLFTQGAGEGTYGMNPGRGVLYLFELATIGAALFWFIVKKQEGVKFLLLWVLIAAIPAALAKGFHAGNRFAVSMPAWQILSAIGLVLLIRLLSNHKPKYRVAFVVITVVIMSLSLISFVEDYAIHAPVANAKSMQYGWRQAIDYIREHEGQYDRIVVSRKFSEPQAFVSLFLPIDPAQFQQSAFNLMAYEREGKPFLDQLGTYTIGKYTFEEIPRGLVPEPGVLYVGTFDELHNRNDIIRQISYPNREPAFLFVAH